MHADSTRSFGKVPWLSEQNTHRTWQTPSGEFHIPMTARNMIQTTTTRTIGRNNCEACVRPSTAHQSITPNAQIAFAYGPTGFCSHFINRQQVTETEYRTQEAARRQMGSRRCPHDTARGTQSFSRHTATGNIGCDCKEGIAKCAAVTSPADDIQLHASTKD